MNYYPESDTHIKNRIKFYLTLSIYPAKSEKNATGIDKSKLARKR